MQPLSSPPTTPEVSITESAGQWFVAVRHADGSVEVEDFTFHAFAVSFAEGQCIRLGVDEIVHQEAAGGPPLDDQVASG